MEDLDAFIDEWLGRRRRGIKPQPAPPPPDYEPVPGLGLITADSPENPNSLRDWRESLLQDVEAAPRSFTEIQADRKREKRKRKRKRHR